MLLLFSCIRVSSKKNFYDEKIATTSNAMQVELNIICDTIKDQYNQNEYIPKEGKIVYNEFYAVKEGDSVYDVLIKCVKKHNMHIDKTGDNSYGMVYIRGLNHIYEYDFGELSGWVYHVDGEEAPIGCAEYKLKGGEVVSWFYTKELGRDVKNRVR